MNQSKEITAYSGGMGHYDTDYGLCGDCRVCCRSAAGQHVNRGLGGERVGCGNGADVREARATVIEVRNGRERRPHGYFPVAFLLHDSPPPKEY
jgi:hypothetical protein